MLALGFSDAHFSYSGPAVKRVAVDFADAAGSFAFDKPYLRRAGAKSGWMGRVRIRDLRPPC